MLIKWRAINTRSSFLYKESKSLSIFQTAYKLEIDLLFPIHYTYRQLNLSKTDIFGEKMIFRFIETSL